MIVCVSVIGATNNPLYLRVFASSKDPLKYHYIVHTSLDIIEDRTKNLDKKVNKPPAASGANKTLTASDMYLGMLFPTETYKIYGYITNTKVKLVAVLEEQNVEIKDFEVKAFFQKFHSLFVDTVSNPFYTFDKKIVSRRFEKKIEELVASFSKK